MASQPIFAPYTPLPSAAPRPNIRIAYIAGDASIAIHRGMAAFPPAVRESTLEELAIAGLTDELIAAGRELLSPPMYAAFLRWGEAASHFATRYETDEEADARCSAAGDAGTILADVPAMNIHDVLLKTRLLNVTEADCADFGSLARTKRLDPKVSTLALAVGEDLATLSPVTNLIEQVAVLAWDNSAPDLMAIDPTLGAIITSAFRAARQALEENPAGPAPVPAIIEGYNRFMRGPLIAWRKAYAEYESATYYLSEFRHTQLEPTAAAFDAVRGDVSKPVTPEMALALATIPMNAAQQHFDDLTSLRYEAIAALMRIPAPSAAELAIKLKILRDERGWELENVAEVMERITTDARRFGRQGPFLQSDGNILAAYAGCRHEMIGAYGPDAMSRSEEDAYFARLDAYETTLLETPAATIEGVVAKLRVAFSRMNPDAWSDHAVMDPTSSDFREGLRMDGMFERIAWGAIEDLARIGGFNLTEQGA